MRKKTAMNKVEWSDFLRGSVIDDKLRVLRLLLLTFAAVMVVSYFSPHVCAHAIIVKSVPATNETVTGPDLQVALTFNSRIDGTRSRVILVGPDQSTRSITLDKQDSPDKINTKLTGLKSGAYVLRWQVLAADGHISRGEIPFKVK